MTPERVTPESDTIERIIESTLETILESTLESIPITSHSDNMSFREHVGAHPYPGYDIPWTC